MFGIDVATGLWSLAGLVPLLAGMAAVALSRRSALDAVRPDHHLASGTPGLPGAAGGAT